MNWLISLELVCSSKATFAVDYYAVFQLKNLGIESYLISFTNSVDIYEALCEAYPLIVHK